MGTMMEMLKRLTEQSEEKIEAAVTSLEKHFTWLERFEKSAIEALLNRESDQPAILPKTPAVKRRRGRARLETIIDEDEEILQSSKRSLVEEDTDARPRRGRAAARLATKKMKAANEFSSVRKLRRPSNVNLDCFSTFSVNVETNTAGNDDPLDVVAEESKEQSPRKRSSIKENVDPIENVNTSLTQIEDENNKSQNKDNSPLKEVMLDKNKLSDVRIILTPIKTSSQSDKFTNKTNTPISPSKKIGSVVSLDEKPSSDTQEDEPCSEEQTTVAKPRRSIRLSNLQKEDDIKQEVMAVATTADANGTIDLQSPKQHKSTNKKSEQFVIVDQDIKPAVRRSSRLSIVQSEECASLTKDNRKRSLQPKEDGNIVVVEDKVDNKILSVHSTKDIPVIDNDVSTSSNTTTDLKTNNDNFYKPSSANIVYAPNNNKRMTRTKSKILKELDDTDKHKQVEMTTLAHTKAKPDKNTAITNNNVNKLPEVIINYNKDNDKTNIRVEAIEPARPVRSTRTKQREILAKAASQECLITDVIVSDNKAQNTLDKHISKGDNKTLPEDTKPEKAVPRITRSKVKLVNKSPQKAIERSKTTLNEETKICLSNEKIAPTKDTPLNWFGNLASGGNKSGKITPVSFSRIKPGYFASVETKKTITKTQPTPDKRNNIVSGVTSFIKTAPSKPTREELEEQKQEDLRKKREKNNEIAKKKEELLKNRAEELKRKNEEKMRKVQAAKEIQLQKLKEAKEQQEQERRQREERLKEEQHNRKKQITLHKKKLEEENKIKLKEQEALRQKIEEEKRQEMRRKAEEAAQAEKERLAKEEKKKKVLEQIRKKEEERLKQAAEAERILREKQELNILQAKETIRNLPASSKEINKTFDATKTPPTQLNSTFDVSSKPEHQNNCNNYHMTPVKKHVKKINVNDYNIDDLTSDESTDDDEKPKKPLPEWANGAKLKQALAEQAMSSVNANKLFYRSILSAPVDMLEIFPRGSSRALKRTSSAIWDTPPLNKSLLRY